MTTAAPESLQLDLFHGAHIPLLRARAALDRGDLSGAHEAFAIACAGQGETEESERLRLLERLLLRRGPPEPSPDDVHAAFAAAFEQGSQPARDAISTAEWFRFYAAHMAHALAREPARRMRGWCALHFELAAGRPDSALAAAHRVVSVAPDGWGRLEAARAAHAAGEAALARRWVLMACLSSREALQPDPPPLTRTGRSELDAFDQALPGLPPAIDALWRDALELDLPGPACAWVPAIGVIDGIVAPAELRSLEVARAGGLDAERSEPGPLTFLWALMAAREARARETPVGRGCGPLEVRARAAMKRAAPPLFERYMDRLGLGLV